jgi:large subunit ribosomal protein L21
MNSLCKSFSYKNTAIFSDILCKFIKEQKNALSTALSHSSSAPPSLSGPLSLSGVNSSSASKPNSSHLSSSEYNPPCLKTQLSPATRVALRTLYQEGPRYYAKISIKGRQFTVTKNDVVITHRIKGPLVGDVLRLNQIRELGSKYYTLLGNPFICEDYFIVRAMVVEHGKGAEVKAKEGKQRKGRRKQITIMPHITKLKILEISMNKEIL